MGLTIVIPAYNEESRLPETLQAVARWARGQDRSVEVVVVDDGSTDKTAEVVESLDLGLPLTLIRQSNCGKGGALRTGVLHASGETVLTMDADLCVPMEDTAKLEAALSDSDIAIGSRYAPGARIEVHQPLSREIAGRLFNLYVSRMVLPGYRDTQCGFKLWKWWAARELFARLATTGFAYDVELLRRAREFGFRVREVGVCWRHKDRGSVSLLRDSVRMFRDTWDLRRMVLPQGGGYDA